MSQNRLSNPILSFTINTVLPDRDYIVQVRGVPLGNMLAF